jgi:hypothetical protein
MAAKPSRPLRHIPDSAAMLPWASREWNAIGPEITIDLRQIFSVTLNGGAVCRHARKSSPAAGGRAALMGRPDFDLLYRRPREPLSRSPCRRLVAASVDS